MNAFDSVTSRLLTEDVSVVASASLPQISRNPAARFCHLGYSTLDRFCDGLHLVDLIERMDKEVNMIGHEDVCEDDKVMLLGCLVDALGQRLADPFIFQMRPSAIG
jgi:hypothetical protein